MVAAMVELAEEAGTEVRERFRMVRSMTIEVAGGGSGFVYKSGVTVPSGYSVPTKYYLTNANTYAGNTSFVGTSGSNETGHSGNGYARITLVSAVETTTDEVSVTGTRWVNIEKQIENGTFTGTFDYNGKVITETDSEGNEIEHEEDTINYVDYIESTGTQYIDTGRKPDSNTEFELSMAITDVSANHAIMGARTTSSSGRYNIFYYQQDIRWDYEAATTFTDISYTNNAIINITKNGNQTTIQTGNTTKTITDSTTEFSTPYNMYLFTLNSQGALDDRYAKMRVYYFKIYQNDVLVRDFKPALDENDVPCLYDTVTKQYFYNTGTGTFNYQ